MFRLCTVTCVVLFGASTSTPVAVSDESCPKSRRGKPCLCLHGQFVCEPTIDLVANTVPQLSVLRGMLQYVLEIEWTVIQPYLTALYSIHNGASRNATAVLREVATEEMFHLASAANVLNAVGGSPSLDGSHFFPDYPVRMQSLHMSVGLEPFSVDQMIVFREVEEDQFGPNPPKHSVGDWYRMIIDCMDELVRNLGEAAVFVGDADRQVSGSLGPFSLKSIRNHLDAKAALLDIMREGSGSNQPAQQKNPYKEEVEYSHYFRFDEIVKGRFYLQGDRPGVPTGAELDTQWKHAVQTFVPNPKAALYVGYPDIHSKMVNLNVCYSTMMVEMHKAFNGAPTKIGPLIGAMFQTTALAKQLMKTQVPGLPGLVVGPSWEWVDITSTDIQPCSGLMLSDDVVAV